MSEKKEYIGDVDMTNTDITFENIVIFKEFDNILNLVRYVL